MSGHDAFDVSTWAGVADLENQPFSTSSDLDTESTCTNFTLGTGHSIISRICPTILEHVRFELIIVTCFWAPSSSQQQLSNLLRQLSASALMRPGASRIRVRICVSSLSTAQRLFHPWSRAGKIHKPTKPIIAKRAAKKQWAKNLGLPSPEEMQGLDVQVKSIFMAPFSVMHPKFVMIDRKIVLLPSCNVSWENWFEGCVELRGWVVACFVRFWEGFWCIGDSGSWNSKQCTGLVAASRYRDEEGTFRDGNSDEALAHNLKSQTVEGSALGVVPLQPSALVRTLFLPSNYHRNPRFRPFSSEIPPVPQTPLNMFLLHLFDSARRTIFIQTPNLTSPPVLAALRTALSRGVQVEIVTNENLMRLEQLVTAGTTTPRCIRKLITGHTQLMKRWDPERGPKPGRLAIRYFTGPKGIAAEAQRLNTVPRASHLKLTIVDEEMVVLGSGNMDRASWYTSQELGVAFCSTKVASEVAEIVRRIDAKFCSVQHDR